MITIYTYSGCSTCKKATRWLKDNGVEFTEKPIRDTPPSVAELKKMLEHVGELKRLFNTAGGDYRELNMKEKLPTLSDEETLRLLASRGNLIKRPFVIGDGVGTIGFKETDWAQLFK